MSDKKKLNNNKELSARLMAVQAYYQILQNKKPAQSVVEEYFARGLSVDDECEEYNDMVAPHGGLFKKILYALEVRHSEIEKILSANINKKAPPIIVIEDSASESEENDTEDSEKTLEKLPEKELEPLLSSILLCGICEILINQDVDALLIINDYLNITHSFYEQQQVSFVNGILDKVASIIRS